MAIKPQADQRRRVLIDKIDSFHSLGKGWDSYAGEPISNDAIMAAILFLDEIMVAPMSDGGVSFEILFEGTELSVDFGPDGKVTGWLIGWDKST